MNLIAAGSMDVDTLTDLHDACFDEAWTRDVVAQVLARPGAFALLARVEDHPAGFALCRGAGEECELLALAVLPRWRRLGLGRRLLHAALKSAAATGAASMSLEVAEDNDAAQALYQANGFSRVGRQPGYYVRPGGERMAALTLRRSLGAQSLRSRRR
ncbi:MAG: GNAT family N-acetyltransferase [Alphaproteobacteria bacterium]